MKKQLFALCLALGVTVPAAAQDGYWNTPNRPDYRSMRMLQQYQEPVQVLQSGFDAVKAFFAGEGQKSAEQIAVFLDRQIAPHFDFAYMAKWVAGGYYDRLGSAEKRALETRIEQDLLGNLARQLVAYSNQSVQMTPPRPGQQGSVRIGVILQNPGSYPARMEFRLYRSADGWKVFDVLAQGRSVLMYYRGQMMRQLRMGQANR